MLGSRRRRAIVSPTATVRFGSIALQVPATGFWQLRSACLFFLVEVQFLWDEELSDKDVFLISELPAALTTQIAGEDS